MVNILFNESKKNRIHFIAISIKIAKVLQSLVRKGSELQFTRKLAFWWHLIFWRHGLVRYQFTHIHQHSSFQRQKEGVIQQMESRTLLCSNWETDIDVTSSWFFLKTFVSVLWLPLFLVHISLGLDTVITTLPLCSARAGVALGLSSAVSGFEISLHKESLVNKPASPTSSPPPPSLLFPEYGSDVWGFALDTSVPQCNVEHFKKAGFGFRLEFWSWFCLNLVTWPLKIALFLWASVYLSP